MVWGDKKNEKKGKVSDKVAPLPSRELGEETSGAQRMWYRHVENWGEDVEREK